MPPWFLYGRLPYISTLAPKLNGGNKALVAAVFFAVAGLISAQWLFPKQGLINEQRDVANRGLVQTAQAQAFASAADAANSDASLAASLPVGNNNADVSSFAYPAGGFVADSGSSISPTTNTSVFFAADVTFTTDQLANLPDFDTDFIIPAQGNYFGFPHNNAVEVTNNCGTPIVASADGLVVPDKNVPDVLGGWNGGYGNFILLEHPFGSGVFTLYAHLGKVMVGMGDYVKQGQEIALMGKTGNTKDCRLRFEVIGAQNPFINN